MYNGVKAMIKAEQELAGGFFALPSITTNFSLPTISMGDIVIHESDMPEDMKQYAIEVTSKAITIYDESQKNDLAKYVRMEFD